MQATLIEIVGLVFGSSVLSGVGTFLTLRLSWRKAKVEEWVKLIEEYKDQVSALKDEIHHLRDELNDTKDKLEAAMAQKMVYQDKLAELLGLKPDKDN